MAAPAGLAGGDGLSSVSSISASSAVRSGFLARCWMADVSRESRNSQARMKSPSFHWLNSAGAGWVNTATVAAGTVAGGTPDAARVDGGCDSFAAPFPGCSAAPATSLAVPAGLAVRTGGGDGFFVWATGFFGGNGLSSEKLSPGRGRRLAGRPTLWKMPKNTSRSRSPSPTPHHHGRPGSCSKRSAESAVSSAKHNVVSSLPP